MNGSKTHPKPIWMTRGITLSKVSSADPDGLALEHAGRKVR